MVKEDFGHSHIWRVAYPLVIGGIAQVIINGTDAAFLGRLSETALGASAIGGLYYVTFFMLGLGFSVGTQILVAKCEGEENVSKVRLVMQQSLFFLCGLAVLLFLLLRYLSPRLLSYFVSSPDILSSSIQFITYRAAGIFPGFAILWVRAFYSGTANTRIISVTTLLTALLNVLFNYLLVFGNLGWPGMGIAGSGLASTLAETLTAVFALLWLAFEKKSAAYRLMERMRFHTETFWELLRLSSPLMLQIYMSLCSWFAFFLIIEKTGSRNLAISNLVRNVYMVLMIPLMGFSNATNTLVSNLMGQMRYREIFGLIGRIALQSAGATLALLFINMLVPRMMLGIFTNDDSLVSDSLASIWVISGSCLLFSGVYILLSAVSGAGDTFQSLVIETFTLVFYLLYVYWLAVKMQLSIEWIWSSEYVYFVILGICCTWYLRSKIRKISLLGNEHQH